MRLLALCPHLRSSRCAQEVRPHVESRILLPLSRRRCVASNVSTGPDEAYPGSTSYWIQERISERANFLLRLLYYPAHGTAATLQQRASGEGGAPDGAAAEAIGAGAPKERPPTGDEGLEWGISAHCDFELFTIMHQSAPGLEASARTSAEAWHVPSAAPGVASVTLEHLPPN